MSEVKGKEPQTAEGKAVAAADARAENTRRNLTLAPDRIGIADERRNIHYATVEIGTTIADLKDPAYWSLVSAKFRPYDRIEVIADDGTLWAEFLILACERTYARVYLLREHRLDTRDVSLTRDVPIVPQMRESYDIRYLASTKHTVIRLSDQKAISENHPTRDAAEAWVREYTKTLSLT